MKQRHIIFLLLLFSATLSVTAQNATNVRARQDGETIVITYDLDKKANVRVLVATGQSNQYTELKAVTGSVGKDISAGVNKQIIWQPLQEQTEFVAQNVRFKVEAKPYYYFSVSETKKIVFSPGNLQYRASTNTWRFAPHQWEYIGAANVKILITSDGWIDIFGWSGSTGAVKWGIGTSQSDSDYSGDFVDWGTNTIGLDAPNTWRTLTHTEWYYLRYTRTDADDLVGVARINLNADGSKYVNGLILLPDGWICPASVTFKSGFANTPSAQAYSYYQTLSLSDWQKLESAGAVFLPVSGSRHGSDVNDMQNIGIYWSATPNYTDYAFEFYFYPNFTNYCYDSRFNGQAVRLVQDLD